MTDFYKQVAKVQSELKANKGQRNAFGNYNYRSCEDILEAAKKVKGELVIYLSDDIHVANERIYVKATATITNGKESLSNTAFAREPLNKKGMDESQITGAASSYARKYALSGLLCIDDTKDADTNEHQAQQESSKNNNDSELLTVMSEGNEFNTAEYWRSLTQEQQRYEWNTLDKESQKELKQLLTEVKANEKPTDK